MKMKNWTFFVILFLGIIISSCKENKDTEDKLSDDPRVRSMVVSGISKMFVINDTESIIYNYDSLSYGTKINSLYASFSGYEGTISVQYLKDGIWTEHVSTSPLDFTSGLRIKSISADGVYSKEYDVDIRIHNYDVEAITWEKVADLPVTATVVSQKTIRFNDSYYLFGVDETGESFVLISSDGENWTSREIVIDNPDWSTLSFMFRNLVVSTETGLYTCDLSSGFVFSPVEVALPAGVKNFMPLFTLNNNFWLMGEESGTYYLYMLRDGEEEYRRLLPLPAAFPVSEITTFLSPSSSNQLGYIFGGKNTDGSGAVWSLDTNGNLLNLTHNQSSLPYAIHSMPLYFEGKLFLVGGKKEEGYTSDFHESTNFGTSWFNNTHKILPDEIGTIGSGYIYEYDRNKVILIGGKNESGFRKGVWKGILNQAILDEILDQ
jgi:hypothetical protein